MRLRINGHYSLIICDLEICGDNVKSRKTCGSPLRGRGGAGEEVRWRVGAEERPETLGGRVNGS